MFGGPEQMFQVISDSRDRSKFRPNKAWDVIDNGVTGFYAKCPELGINASFVLPYCMNAEARDFSLWAFEWGHAMDVFDGEAKIKYETKRLLGL